MSNAITLFDGAGLPAYLQDLNTEGNIEVREQVPQLSFRGKVWRVVKEGTESIVKNSEGDPVQAVQVIILDYNKKRGRAYYPSGFEEGKTTPPTCWSKDSEKPDASIREPQAATCATCPQSVKGSKITDAGKEVTACASYKRAAVVPLVDPKFTPLLLKIPQTSMWDKDNKENEAQGFYSFDQYMTMLNGKGIRHTADVVTKIKFDMRTAYPKLLFGAHMWLPQGAVVDIKEQLARKEELAALLNVMDTTQAPEEVIDDSEPTPVATPAPAAATPAATPAARPARPTGRPPVQKPTPAPPSAAKPLVDPDDTPVSFGGNGAATPAPTLKAVPAPAPTVATTTVPAADTKGLDTLVEGWDD